MTSSSQKTDSLLSLRDSEILQMRNEEFFVQFKLCRLKRLQQNKTNLTVYVYRGCSIPEQSDNLSVSHTDYQVLSISFPHTEMSLHGALLSPEISIVLSLFFQSSKMSSFLHQSSEFMGTWLICLMGRSDHNMLDYSIILSKPRTPSCKREKQ